MSLTVALSKGKLLAGSEALFRGRGLPFPGGEGRKLVVPVDGLRFLFVKDMDVPTYVEYGVADCGIAGRDVLLETGSDVYEPLDLGFGRCRLVVARLRGSGFAYDRASTVRVATKYPRVTSAHFLDRGVSVEVVRLPARSRSPPASASPTASWTWWRRAAPSRRTAWSRSRRWPPPRPAWWSTGPASTRAATRSAA